MLREKEEAIKGEFYPVVGRSIISFGYLLCMCIYTYMSHVMDPLALFRHLFNHGLLFANFPPERQ